MPRKQKKYHYLYKTTNNLSGKYYYGMHSTDNLNDGYYGSGKRLRYSINKYGKENHSIEILEFFSSRKELVDKEIINLNEIAKHDCMNLMVGGQGGFVSIDAARKGAISTNSKYLSEKMEWTSKGGKSTFLKHGTESKFFKKRCDWTGKKHSDESISKMSESKKGKFTKENNSQYNTCWITNGVESKKINKEDNIPNGWKLGRKMPK